MGAEADAESEGEDVLVSTSASDDAEAEGGADDIEIIDFAAIELGWPGKSRAKFTVVDSQNRWHLADQNSDLELFGLQAIQHYGEPTASDGLVLTGDRHSSLSWLSASLSGRVTFAYFDAPRVIVDDEASAFRAADGQHYSTWIQMLYATLYGTHALIARDGVVAVHVGEDEAPFARLVCDEVFGRGNRVASIVWQKAYAPRNMPNMKEFTVVHDHLYVYARSKETLGAVGFRQAPKGFSNPDDDPRGPWKAEHKGAATRRESTDFDTFVPPYRWELEDGDLPPGVWRVSPLSGAVWADELLEEGEFEFTVHVTDSAGASASRTLAITVSDAADPPGPAQFPWAFEEIQPSGELRVVTDALPAGRVGEPYSAVILADGGSPFTSEPKRPTPPRWWEISIDTLKSAYAVDAVDFGRSGDAIPKIKQYLDADAVVVTNQTTWWPGRRGAGKKTEPFAGYTQDATRHLKSLHEDGYVDVAPPRTGKPEALLARLVHIFSRPRDVVLEVAGDTGDLAAVAAKLDRRFVTLRTESDRSVALTEGFVVPRLKALALGKDGDLDAGEDIEVPERTGALGFACASLSEWVVSHNLREDVVTLSPDIPQGDLAERVLTANGYLPTESFESLHFGRRLHDESSLAVHVAPEVFLSLELVAQISSDLKASVHRRLAIFYYRHDDELQLEYLPLYVTCRRVPFDLGGRR